MHSQANPSRALMPSDSEFSHFGAHFHEVIAMEGKSFTAHHCCSTAGSVHAQVGHRLVAFAESQLRNGVGFAGHH